VRAPAVLLAVPFLAGAAVSVVFVDRLGPGVPFVSAAAALVLLVAATGFALLEDIADASATIVGACLLSGLALGADAARAAYAPPLLIWFDRGPHAEPVVLEGVLQEDAARTPFGASLTVDVTRIHAPSQRTASGIGASSDAVTSGPGATSGSMDSGWRVSLGGVRLSVTGSFVEARAGAWRAGRVIRAPALLRRPTTYFNPGGADDGRSLARRGIVLVGSIKSGALVEVVRRGSIVSETGAACRAWVRSRIAAHMSAIRPEQSNRSDDDSSGNYSTSGGVATAVLIGDRTGLGAEDERRLQDAGTYHVIAISGGNIAVLAVLALLACRALLMPPRLAAVTAAAALVLYGYIAGGAASVVRAVTVAVLILAGRALDHRGPSLNALAVAAVISVAAAPVVVLDPGFILSFGATLAILAGVPRLVPQVGVRQATPLSRALRRAAAALATLLAATVCAEASLAPIGATLFGRVTFAGLVLNFAAIPLMTVVQVGGLVLLAASVCSTFLANAAATAVHLAAAALLASARLVELAPWLAPDVPPPALWLTAAYYLCAFGLLIRRSRRLFGPALAVVAVVMFAGPVAATRDGVPRGGAPLRIVMLDVGQGDASVVFLPGRRALLVDSGGVAAFSSPEALENVPAFDVGQRIVWPALRALGATDLEAIVLTHGDPDHLGGAAGVLRHAAARSIWEGVPVPRHAGLRALAALAHGRGMSWRTVQAGDVERFGAVEVRVLHPPPPEWERQRVRNEDSVVLEVRLGRVSVILPGDIGREGELAILSRLEQGRVVVLKAPHHGSATSSTPELLEALRPAAVVFSAGRDNRFGHPHPAVVERYRGMGSRIFSTAQDGAVFVESDGTEVEIYGWRQLRITPRRGRGVSRLP
jgi:competence protein ComEC